MKIYNNLEEFLEENEINNYTAEKIFTECSRFNPYLENFLKDKHWKEIPLYFAELFINLYHASKVNMITGKILNPIESLISLPFVYFDSLKLELKVEGDIEAMFPPEIVILEIDEDDEVDMVSSGSQMSSECFLFDYNGDDEFVEEVNIDLNAIHPAIKKVEILVANCSPCDDFAADKITLSLFIENQKIQEIDLTDEFIDEEGINVIDLYWNVNGWLPTISKK